MGKHFEERIKREVFIILQNLRIVDSAASLDARNDLEDFLDASIVELGADSLQLMEVCIQLERQLEVELSPNKVVHLGSIRNLIGEVARILNSREQYPE